MSFFGQGGILSVTSVKTVGNHGLGRLPSATAAKGT